MLDQPYAGGNKKESHIAYQKAADAVNMPLLNQTAHQQSQQKEHTDDAGRKGDG